MLSVRLPVPRLSVILYKIGTEGSTMTNFKLTIQYDGGRYNGWQRLGNTDNTIQGKIERVLSEMTGHAVEIHGAGRTDAGVHAAAQVASFKLNTTRSPEENSRVLKPLPAAGYRHPVL